LCDQAADPAEAGYYRQGRYVDPPTPTLIVGENPKVGELLGPDGRPARIVKAKPERTIGFRPGGNR
jgi:hypothetical protein